MTDNVIDSRLQNLDEHFREVLGELEKIFMAMASLRGGRAFHTEGTTAKGRLQVMPQPDVPAHPFFVSGKTYPVLLRHFNGATEDDAAWDNRGATVRVLHPDQPDRFDNPLLDLLLATGECFPNGTAEEFLVWVRADAKTRERIANRAPHISKASWEMYRAGQSYMELHYYSKVVSHFRSEEGQWFVRYRLVPPDKRADSGFLQTEGNPLPPNRMPRQPGDERSITFLHEAFRAQVQAGGVDYLLQVQLRPVSASDSENDAAVDCSRPWSHDEFPWRDVAMLHLDSLVDNKRIAALQFNPFNTPPELGMILAKSATQYASLNHTRSIVYEKAAAVRLQSASAPMPSPVRAVQTRELVPILTSLNTVVARTEMISNRVQDALRGVKALEAEMVGALQGFTAALVPRTRPVRTYSIQATILLAPIQPSGSQPPAYCIHPLDGGITMYVPMAKLLATDRPVVAVQPVGMLGKEAPLERVEAIAERFCREIEQQQPSGPYNLIGASMGGLIALEMAHIFRRKGARVFVGLLDTFHPDIWNSALVSNNGVLTMNMLLKPLFNTELNLRQEELRGLDAHATLDRMVRAIDASGVLQPYQQRKWKIFQADYRAALDYRPRYYPGQIALTVATDAKRTIDMDETLGWKQYAESVLRIAVPGDHGSAMVPPHVSALASHIHRLLLNSTHQ